MVSDITFVGTAPSPHTERHMQEPPTGKLFKYRWLIFWIMAVSYVFVYFHRLCPAVVAVDLQNAFQASAGFMGLLASAYFYPYAIMQFPAGLLSDTLGPRKTAAFFLVIAGAGSLMFGLAPSMEVALAARIIVGLGASMVFIPAMKILSQWFRVREFASMTAILAAMGGVGALTATTPLALMTEWFGWRVSFEIIGVATLVMALLVWTFVRNRPQDMGWPSVSEIDSIGPGTSAPPLVIPVWEGALRVVRERYFWPVAAWFFFSAGVFFGFGGLWAGPYFMHVYGMSRAEAGNVLTMIAVGLIVGSPLASILSDRVLRSRKKVLVMASSLVVCLILLLNAFPEGFSHPMLYLFMFLFSICSAATIVVGFTTAKELFPVEIAGTSVGTVNLFPFLGGAIFQPVLGWILDAYGKDPAGIYPIGGYKALLIVLLASSVLGLVASLVMKETFPGSVGSRY
ncbi:MAG: MFS transporter [Desulfomonile tiedjei]|nr:MFS transporter [Desulfomonile tiedjei]